MADGTLSCSSTCHWEDRDCLDACCGDGEIDRGEQCDSGELGGLTCEVLGYAGGGLACDDLCRLDSSACTGDGGRCGDGTATEALGELCDGSDTPFASCADLGYAGGGVDCAPDCQSYDFESCVPRTVGSAGACSDPIEVPGDVAEDGYVHAFGNTAAGSAVDEGSCGGGGPEEVFRIVFPGGGSTGGITVMGLDGEPLDDVVFYLRETCEAATELACSRSGAAVRVPLSASRTYLLFVDGPAPLPAFGIVFGAIF